MSLVLTQLGVHSDDRDCLLSLSGDVDLAAAADISGNALHAVGSATAPRVAVDLSRVTFMDAAGLGLLVQIHAVALQRGTLMQLLAVPRAVERLIALGGLAEAFGRADTCGRC